MVGSGDCCGEYPGIKHLALGGHDIYKLSWLGTGVPVRCERVGGMLSQYFPPSIVFVLEAVRCLQSKFSKNDGHNRLLGVLSWLLLALCRLCAMSSSVLFE